MKSFKKILKEEIFLLTESRVTDAYKKYKEHIDDEREGQYDNSSVYDTLIEDDFIKKTNYKYLDWILDKWYLTHMLGIGWFSTLGLVMRFDSVKDSLDVKDLYQYKSYEELNDAVQPVYEEKKKRRELEKAKKESIKLLDDGDFLVIKPLSHVSSCAYGGGTKWCTASAKEDKHFTKYTETGELYYIIDKNKKDDNPLYKIAVYITKNDFDKMEIYNAPDHRLPVKIENILPKKVISVIETDFYNKYEKVLNTREIKNIITDWIDSRNTPIEVGEFKIYTDNYVGTFYWDLVRPPKWIEDFRILATPFWDDDDTIPIDYEVRLSNDIEDMDHVGTIPTGDLKLKNPAEVLTWFKDFYIPSVHAAALEFLQDNNYFKE